MRLRSTSDPGVGLGRDTLPNLKARKPIAKGEAGRGKGKGVKVVVKRMVMGKRKARAAPGSAQAALSGPAPQARRKSSAAGSATLQADTLNEIFARVESQTVCREVLPLVCKRFRDALAEPSAVWESLSIDFLHKGVDLEQPGLALPGDEAPADEGRNRRIMRTAVESWLEPRARAVKRLVLTFSEKDPTHSFPKNGHGLAKVFAMLGPSLQSLNIANCNDIFRAASFADLTVLQHLEELSVAFNTAMLSSADLAPLDLLKRLRKLRIACSAEHEEDEEVCIKPFPESLLKIRGLTSLALASRGIEAVPAGITRLRDLACLDLSGCPIRSLPPALTKLPSLRELRLNSTQLPLGLASTWIALTKLPELEELELRDTNLMVLPPLSSSHVIKHLTSLDLGGNQLGPAWIGISHVLGALHSMPNLRRLNLSRTQLGALPDTLCKLKGLTHLNISHNQLVDLPEDMQQMTALRELVALSNSFPRIPEVLHKMPVLVLADLSFSIYMEAAASLEAMAREGFPCLQHLDLRKFVGCWKPSSLPWLRGLAAALEVAGRPKGCLVWDTLA